MWPPTISLLSMGHQREQFSLEATYAPTLY